MGGEIVELDIALHITCWSGSNGLFLRPFMNGRGQVSRAGAFQRKRIDLLKCQLAVPDLVLVIPNAIVAQLELVHCEMQMCPVRGDLIENGFVTTGVG